MIHKEVHATAYLYPLVSVKLAWVGMGVLYKVHRPPQKVDDRSGGVGLQRDKAQTKTVTNSQDN